MKKYLVILCVLCIGCASGGRILTKNWYTTEQERIDAYYGARASGFAFDHSFYEKCDSTLNASNAADAKLLTPIYSTVTAARRGDSTDMWSGGFFTHLQQLIDASFTIAKGVYK